MKIAMRVFLIIVIALGVGMGFWFYLNNYLIKSKASEAVAKISFTEEFKKAKGGDTLQVGLVVSAGSRISAVDVTFDSDGKYLNFLYQKSMSQMPPGFDLQLLDESEATTLTQYGTKALKRLIFVSKNPDVNLPSSIVIPLHFVVVNNGQGAAKSTLKAYPTSSIVTGPTAPGTQFTLVSDKAPTFTVELDDNRAAVVNGLECDVARNVSPANCGRGVALKWNDTLNEDGYKIYKNNVLVKSVGKDTTSFNDGWCANYNPNIYSIVAYNADGQGVGTAPTVNCACLICPTAMPPTPTPVLPTNSADLIFRVVFPDVAPQIAEVPDVQVTVLDNFGKRICDGDSDCAKVITFKRDPSARIANTFVSPQLQYPLKKNQAYSLVVKHPHTVRQVYKHVYLKWQKILQCTEGTGDSACGELIEVVVKKPLFSGDLDGNNAVDQSDADKVTVGVGVTSAEGDLNFDKVTDQKDIEILGKNFSKKGT